MCFNAWFGVSMEILKGYLSLIRPINCLIMGFAVIVGAAIANPYVLVGSWRNLFFGFLTGFLLTGASMVINDYYDREIDAINEPERPIPSGLVNPKKALIFAFVLSITGFSTAYLTNTANLFCFITALFSWVVSVTYVTVGKRTGLVGNFLVSICVAVPFIYGSLAVSEFFLLNVLVFTVMAFLSNTGREITKGIVDVEGDKARNVKTLAVAYGERKAAFAAVLFYLAAVSLSPIPVFFNLVNTLFYLPIVAFTDLGFLASSISLLRDYSRGNARKVKKTVLLWFVTGLMAFMFGAVG